MLQEALFPVRIVLTTTMSTRSVTCRNRFLFRSKKHPVLSFHAFARGARELSINFQFPIACITDFFLPN